MRSPTSLVCSKRPGSPSIRDAIRGCPPLLFAFPPGGPPSPSVAAGTLQVPVRSGFLAAGANGFGFPFGSLGTPLAGIFNHCADATETHKNAMVGRIMLSILLTRETGALGLRRPSNSRVYTLMKPGEELIEYSCEENNKDFIDGHIKYLVLRS